MAGVNMEKQKFMDSLKKQECPFCGKKLKYYDGALGYEAMLCDPCKLTIDHNGIHIED